MRLILLLAVSFAVTACSPLSRSATASNDQSVVNTENTEIENPNNDLRDLSDHLRRVAGVTVRGNGSTAQVYIRGGVTDLSGPQEPLFVINGTPVQGGFGQVVNMVPVQDVDNIRVLKGTETSIYGSRGSHGVIEIKTK